MKRVIASFLLIFSFFSCSGQKTSFENWMEGSSKGKVLATTAMIADLVRAVGKERVDLLVLIEGEIDPHSYELVKGDDEKLHKADLIFYNGLGLEHGASLSYCLENSPKAISLGGALCRKFPEKILFTSDGTTDPHIWMDISLWAESIEIICEKLQDLDPEGKAFYQKNAQHVKNSLLESHHQIKESFQKIPSEKRYMVTTHDAFHYFARSYLAAEEEKEEVWRSRVAAPEGLAPEGEISPLEIKKVLSYLQEHEVKVLFPESNLSQSSLRKIANDARSLGLHITLSQEPLYGDTMPKRREEELGYLQMLKDNARTILKAME